MVPDPALSTSPLRGLHCDLTAVLSTLNLAENIPASICTAWRWRIPPQWGPASVISPASCFSAVSRKFFILQAFLSCSEVSGFSEAILLGVVSHSLNNLTLGGLLNLYLA